MSLETTPLAHSNSARPRQVCDCELKGFWNSGLPGVLAEVRDGCIESVVLRCDICERFATDEDAERALADHLAGRLAEVGRDGHGDDVGIKVGQGDFERTPTADEAMSPLWELVVVLGCVIAFGVLLYAAGFFRSLH